MNSVEIFVLVAGVFLIVFILWFFLGPKKKAEVKNSSQGIQEIEIVVEGGYKPSQIIVKKGNPVKITFDRKESGECSEWVVFEKLNLKKRLAPFSKTILEFTPKESGEFPFACGMGMLHGKLIVRN